MNDLMKRIPLMLTGEELRERLQVLPEYDSEIVTASVSTRLMAMSDIYRIYVPSQMSEEIYGKMYLSLLRSLEKKGTQTSVRQQKENRKAILEQDYSGIIGGADSFSIIGESGIGKSAAIGRAISLLQGREIIVTKKPFLKVIPIVCVQCPFDCSVKGMLLEILRVVDKSLRSRYHENALRGRVTTDMLIGVVSQVAINHIGVLVVDEIQNVVDNRNGKNLVGMLTQLINNSGISICMVGTPESAIYFESAMYLARRSLGLNFSVMEYDDYFREFCQILLSYRFVQQETDITEGLLNWLYEHSGGNISVVVSLIHDAQEIAILDGSEQLTLKALKKAYDQRLFLMHDYIRIKPKPVSKKTPAEVAKRESVSYDSSLLPEHYIQHKVAESKENDRDVISVLRKGFAIEEIQI